MADAQIRFNDGASYDRLMGEWSRMAGSDFLDWLQPAPGLAWLDVGCGSGAFSSLVVERCAPRSLLGIDPSEGQLDFARSRGLDPVATFATGDAMQIDVPDSSTDMAVAALVLHFMPEPLRGVREMVRVVRPGGVVATYTWDLKGGGFPYEAMHRALPKMGFETPSPPHAEAGNAEEMRRLWTEAGLEEIRQLRISVSRAFRDFDHYWQMASLSPRVAATLGNLTSDQLALVRDATRALLPESMVITASANAISGRVAA